MPQTMSNGCFGFNVKNDSIEMNGKEQASDVFKVEENSLGNISKMIEDEEEIEYKKPTFYKRIFFWICGIEQSIKKKTKAQIEMEKVNEASLMEISIEETPFWRKFNLINVAFQLSVCGFLWVFFNKF